MNAYPRMTSGIPHFFEGVNFLTATMGYFCFSEMMRISKRDFILQDVSQYQGDYSETLKGALHTLVGPSLYRRRLGPKSALSLVE